MKPKYPWAKEAGATKFPFVIYDDGGREAYYETEGGTWWRKDYDSLGRICNYESSLDVSYTVEYDIGGNMIIFGTSLGKFFMNLEP